MPRLSEIERGDRRGFSGSSAELLTDRRERLRITLAIIGSGMIGDQRTDVGGRGAEIGGRRAEDGGRKRDEVNAETQRRGGERFQG